jgi:hypothetical protein
MYPVCTFLWFKSADIYCNVPYLYYLLAYFVFPILKFILILIDMLS